jgi:hypothetical protein
MRMLAEEDQINEVESAINLPDVEECIKILEEALADSLYEPFIMISKRILQAITGLIDISDIHLGSFEDSQNEEHHARQQLPSPPMQNTIEE